ncbi:SRPBCC family protein [Phyllobacterium sp. YR531]|uniref:SRPBCC family protein n=1 Tax=Phyllobacterium sp. YR531 TaxID=1144343 RepID=UPI0002E72B54|nr:SRPBCC family protein [Phyllobacterium sp. YR531]
MLDRIEKNIELNAPIEKVWHALTDYQAFGEWFRVKIEKPFVVGEVSTGYITYPGYEHVKWQVTIKAMDAPHLFSFTWHPYAIDPDVDYSGEAPTVVEFHLKATENGTHLRGIESGFDAIPTHRRNEAMRANEGGWEEQMKNIKAYVER